MEAHESTACATWADSVKVLVFQPSPYADDPTFVMRRSWPDWFMRSKDKGTIATPTGGPAEAGSPMGMTGTNPGIVNAANDMYTITSTPTTIASTAGVLANDWLSDVVQSLTVYSGRTTAAGNVTLASDGGFTFTPTVGFIGESALTRREARMLCRHRVPEGGTCSAS